MPSIIAPGIRASPPSKLSAEAACPTSRRIDAVETSGKTSPTILSRMGTITSTDALTVTSISSPTIRFEGPG